MWQRERNGGLLGWYGVWVFKEHETDSKQNNLAAQATFPKIICNGFLQKINRFLCKTSKVKISQYGNLYYLTIGQSCRTVPGLFGAGFSSPTIQQVLSWDHWDALDVAHEIHNVGVDTHPQVSVLADPFFCDFFLQRQLSEICPK